MSMPEIKTDSTRYLLVGYFVLAAMFSALWWLDSNQINSQKTLISITDASAQKMRLSADLIEIIRTRIILSNEMLSESDAFIRDDIFVEIQQFGGLYVKHLRQLKELPLNDSEKRILEHVELIHEQLDERLEDLSAMLFEVDRKSLNEVQRLVLDEILPMQAELIDGYMTILRDIQLSITDSSQLSLKQYEDNSYYRYILLVAVTIGSLMVLYWVIQLMLSIEKSLHTTSLTDKLTAIANRRCFDQMFAHIWEDSMRNKKLFALLIIDIDHFKLYNDFYGHQQGDDCLANVARAMKSVIVRKNDVVARYGGEEFAIILSNTDRTGAVVIAEKLLNAVRDLNISHEKSLTAEKITISIGIAVTLPNADIQRQEMLEEADQALYKSKHSGRNRASLINEQFGG